MQQAWGWVGLGWVGLGWVGLEDEGVIQLFVLRWPVLRRPGGQRGRPAGSRQGKHQPAARTAGTQRKPLPVALPAHRLSHQHANMRGHSQLVPHAATQPHSATIAAARRKARTRKGGVPLLMSPMPARSSVSLSKLNTFIRLRTPGRLGVCMRAYTCGGGGGQVPLGWCKSLLEAGLQPWLDQRTSC